MEKLKKYKKQIVTFITIFLLLTYGIYPCLTMANTFANILGGIALMILILWGILEVKDVYNKEEDSLKKKSNPKQFDGVKSDEPFVKTKRKPKTK